jgi:hypothetical protein
MIAFELADKNTAPPGGWFYRQAESGMTFQHYSRDAFFEAIRSHRLANGYPIEPQWKEEIEDLMCRVKVAEWGQGVCRRVENLGERRSVSFAASQSFLNTMASWMAALRRASLYLWPRRKRTGGRRFVLPVLQRAFLLVLPAEPALIG